MRESFPIFIFNLHVFLLKCETFLYARLYAIQYNIYRKGGGLGLSKASCVKHPSQTPQIHSFTIWLIDYIGNHPRCDRYAAEPSGSFGISE